MASNAWKTAVTLSSLWLFLDGVSGLNVSCGRTPIGNIIEGQTREVTITCRMTNLPKVGPLPVSRFLRKLINGTQEEWETISDNNIGSSAFKARKYVPDLIHNNADNSLVATLKIPMPTGQDGGDIRFFTAGVANPISKDINLQIHTAVEKAEFILISENGTKSVIPDGSTVTLKQGWGRGVACEVTLKGTSADPDIKMTIGGADSAAAFTQKRVRRLSYIESNTLHATSVTEWRYQTWTPDPLFNGKTVVCSATSMGFTTAKTASINLKVETPPKILCDHVQVFKKAGETVDVTCQVYGNPTPSVTWQWGVTGNENKLQSPGRSGKITFGEMRSPSGGLVTAHFKINPVDKSHFLHYNLYAKNSYGTGRRELVIYEDRGKRPFNSASRLSSGASWCVSGFAVIMAVHGTS